jgi:glycosyltransferase involved in cell wall biosynthesis
MVKAPDISIVIPTLNSQRTLEVCLESISRQKYEGKLEIIIADGGSSDSTVKIAKKYGARIVLNKLKTGESGKAVGARNAEGDIIAFIDSDNVLPGFDWLKRMVVPFGDKDIIASEPIIFGYNKKDHWLTRYFALLGMGDPINLFLGNYDHFSYISGKWTELPIKYKENKSYITLLLNRILPTIGANGFMIRSSELKSYLDKDYLFDIDILKEMIRDRGEIRIAKVKLEIIHLFSGNINTFVRKQKRRIRDLLYYRSQGIRYLQLDKTRLIWGTLKFVIATLVVVPLFLQVLAGYLKKNDTAWLFHPLACWLTLIVYTWETIRFGFIKENFDRVGWKQ